MWCASLATIAAAAAVCARYAGTWDAISRIWREEGLGGYYKGMRAKLLQTALNAALMLMIKEQVRGDQGGDRAAAATVMMAWATGALTASVFHHHLLLHGGWDCFPPSRFASLYSCSCHHHGGPACSC